MRRLTLVVAVVLIAACGESPLADLGQRSSAWIDVEQAEPPSRLVDRDIRPIDLIATSDVRWWNDDLTPSTVPVSLADISSRRSPGDRFAQASRREIATFFPDLEFPGRVPAEVRSVTSQLVLSASEPTFDGDHIASFGLWTSDPYTRSRSVGQLGTIAVFAGASNDPCGVAGSDCAVERVGERTVGRVTRPAGTTVVWSDAARTYEMFVREPAMSAVPAMIESIATISELVDEPAAEPAAPGQADLSPEAATVP